MRLTLPRFRLPPKDVVFVAGDGSRRYFKIATRWDGSLRLRERKTPVRRRSALLVVDAEIPLRRLFRIPARHRGTRNLLLATAADAFPFDVDEGLFALGERDAHSYVFALERSRYEALAEDIDRPAAVLVAASESGSDVGAAVRNWLRDGAVRDMLGRPRPLRPASLLLAAQALALLVAAWFVLDAWTQRGAVRAEQRQALLERTREQAKPLLDKRRSVFRMVEVDRALTHLQQLPASQLPTRLGALIGALPEGTRIDRIQLTGRELVISGWGSDPALWLENASAARVETKKLPKDDRFKITFDLGG